MAVRLFVGNLSYATTEVDLRTYFGTVAPPSQVVLPVDRETGRTRGFAFVEYPGSRARRTGDPEVQWGGVQRPPARRQRGARARRSRVRVDRRGLADSAGLGLAGSAVRGPAEASAPLDSILRRRRRRAAAATSVPMRSPRADQAPRRSRKTPSVRGGRSPRSSPDARSASTMTKTSATSRCRTSTTSRQASRKTKRKTPRSSAGLQACTTSNRDRRRASATSCVVHRSQAPRAAA